MIKWEAHACLPLHPQADFSPIEQFHAAGVNYVSINIGMDMNPLSQVMATIAGFRATIAASPQRYVLVNSAQDIRDAAAAGKLAIGFDLEGAMPLLEQPEMVAMYRSLGVRQMHLAYNRNNSVAGGCHDEVQGLTPLGHRIVAAINTAGVLMDCSHTGRKGSLDIMAASTAPVIFSHSNPLALVEHAGMPVADHWMIYLPVVLVSFVLMVPPIMAAERRGKMKMMFIGAVSLLVVVHLGFALAYRDFWTVVVLLTLFFTAFNVLEASLPSLITKLAPAHARGTAIGVYNTTQALGLFVGPWIGGWIAKNYGVTEVFVFGIALFALWVVVAWPMRAPGDLERRNFPLGKAADPVALREGLAQLRGVRDVVVSPEEGIARLTFYRGMLDEQAVMKLVAGEAPLSPDNA